MTASVSISSERALCPQHLAEIDDPFRLDKAPAAVSRVGFAVRDVRIRTDLGEAARGDELFDMGHEPRSDSAPAKLFANKASSAKPAGVPCTSAMNPQTRSLRSTSSMSRACPSVDASGHSAARISAQAGPSPAPISLTRMSMRKGVRLLRTLNRSA